MVGSMIKVVTFSTNVSAGHRRAAEAVARAIVSEDREARIVEYDAMNLMGSGRGRILAETYLGILRYRPSLWNFLYRNKNISGKIAKFFRVFLARAGEAFEAEIEKHCPDVIVCTQVIPARVIAALKEMRRCDAPLLAVATDYGMHPYWATEYIDEYAVPCREAALELEADGIEPDRIHVTGIPVDSVFEAPPGRFEARRDLGLDPDGRYVLAMGGGNGLGLEAGHVRLIEETPGVDGVLVISGCNRLLERTVREMPATVNGAGRRVERRVFSIVDRIQRLYAAADLLVSKPGGLTMSEATAMSMPIVMIAPLPGQEERNAEFLRRAGAALEARSETELKELLAAVIASPTRLGELSRASREVGRPEASRQIAKMALRLAQVSARPRELVFSSRSAG